MRAAHTPNVLPLSRAQWWALVVAAGRELRWGLRAVSREVDDWRSRAAAIPDPALRRDALHAIDAKRGHIDGAAMFWTLPRRRSPTLLRTLVRYELLQDFLDGVTEPDGSLGPVEGAPLYAALAEALDPGRPRSSGFSDCGRDDGGYLAALVDACRDGCRALPSYDAVRPLLMREAERAEVLLLNHEPRPAVREAALRAWAQRQGEGYGTLRWHELTAAASGWITTHALLSLAAHPAATSADAEETYAAYFPWLALTLTLLDGYADHAEDAANGSHNYLAYFASLEAAAARLAESIRGAAAAVHSLPDGDRHAVLLACMIALYLSKDSVRAPEMRAMTAEIVAAGGSLTQFLLPILRIWRVCNGQRRAT
jgi:tetraprenyl-beta-curcumene synthase